MGPIPALAHLVAVIVVFAIGLVVGEWRALRRLGPERRALRLMTLELLARLRSLPPVTAEEEQRPTYGRRDQ